MKIFERKYMNKSAIDLVKMNEHKKLCFDNMVQRSLVWKNTKKDNRKSLLIHSMIIGFPIPPMFCNCIIDSENIRNRYYDFIDGKQRTNTVCEFINDKFPLINVPLINLDENSDSDEDADDDKLIDVNGMKFSDLPDDIKRIIENYQFVIYYYENLTDEEFKEMMFRLNNGKGLTAAEKVRINTKDQKVIMELAQHKIFSEALSAGALNGFTNEVIVKQTWGILNIEDVSFQSKNFDPIIENAVITEEQQKEIINIFDILYDCNNIIKTKARLENDTSKKKNIDKVAKRILGRIHISSIAFVIKYAIQNNISKDQSKDQLCEWMIHFFYGAKTTISESYNTNAHTGTATARAIKIRKDEVMTDFINFISDKQQEPVSEQNDMQADEQDSEN